MPSRLLTSLALVAAVGTAGVLPAVAGPTEGTPGIGDEYYPKDGNGGIDVRRYDVGVTYEFEARDTDGDGPRTAEPPRLTGDTTLTIRAKRPLSSFHLDLLLPVQAVTVDGVAATYTKPSRHELRIEPPAPIAEGDVFEVRVQYAGNPDAVTYLGEDNWLADHAEVVTMNEPHMAPWWFPANDHPRDKARFDITITTDADKDVISNGEQVGDPVVDGGLATTHWRMARPMTTYLAYFAAGSFEVTEDTTGGIPWTTAVSERFEDTAQRHFKRVVNRSGRVTTWLEGELGDYPFDSTGGLVTTLPAGFALENQTRPTYSGGIGQEVLVHELAHQWFGNSVSVRRWRDIWLNEGFATYMEVRYKAQHGRASVREWLLRTHRWYDDPHSGFWQVNIADPGAEIHQLFSWPVYERGAMALAALRGKLGGATFDRLLRTWGTKNEYGVAQVGDFVRMAERAAGQQLDRFFRVWLREPEAPARTEANGF